MREPKCAMCGDPTVRTYEFADYAPLPDGERGHPSGLEYFCARHDPSAFTHLSLGEAWKALKESPDELGSGLRFPPPPPPPTA